MRSIQYFIYLFISIALFSCSNGNGKADGYGNFEATEVIVSSESDGKLMEFKVDEGQTLERDAFVGYVDTIPLSLKRDQLLASEQIIASKSRGVLSQINVLNAQLKTAMIDKTRIENLIKDNAATQKQLDDINGQINVLKQQKLSVESQNAPVVAEYKNIKVQLKQIEDQIQKSKIINPINGTIITKYAEQSEVVSFGKQLYKIADLSKLELRVYISETQLASLKIGQQVTVKIDDREDMKSYDGIISWIASEAEFTPKIIQTKEERVALVYAVKVDVTNDGSLKIGMPAEMWISTENN
jgi:HlyD family secretion protein